MPRPGQAPRTRTPWGVVVLTVVTLGIYSYVFWWKASRAVTAWTQDPQPHRHARRGILLSIAALAAILLFIAPLWGLLLFSADTAENGDGTEEDPPVPVGAFFALFGLAGLGYVLAMALSIAGIIFLYMGMWGVWRFLHHHGTAPGHEVPRPITHLLVHILGPFVASMFLWIPMVILLVLFAETAPAASAPAWLMLIGTGYLLYALGVYAPILWVMHSTARHLNRVRHAGRLP